MAIFLYRNPDTNEIREIVQSVHEEHSFTDEKGLKWVREFTNPTVSVDNKWDANNPRDFVEKSAKKHGTVNDLWEKSAELSEKRIKQFGKDDTKSKFYKDYNKKTKKLHPDQRKEKLEKIKNTEIELKIKK